MEFRPEDVRAFLKVLAADPEAREDFARVVLPHEFVALTQSVDTLTQSVDALTVQMQALVTRVDRLGDQMGDVRGQLLEFQYWFRPGRFHQVAQGPRPLSPDARDELLRAAVSEGRLTREEAGEIYNADLILAARRWADDADVLLLVEVSAVVDAGDVERAVRRAELLGRTGTPSRAVVAGARVTPVATETAHSHDVWLVTDGKGSSPGPP